MFLSLSLGPFCGGGRVGLSYSLFYLASLSPPSTSYLLVDIAGFADGPSGAAIHSESLPPGILNTESGEAAGRLLLSRFWPELSSAVAFLLFALAFSLPFVTLVAEEGIVYIPTDSVVSWFGPSQAS